MTIKTWLENAIQDAERRGLLTLRPLLEALARSTSALRSADWNLDATGQLDDNDDAVRRRGVAASTPESHAPDVR